MLGLINETIAKNILKQSNKQPIHLRFRSFAKRKKQRPDILKKIFRRVLLENKCCHIFAPALVERDKRCGNEMGDLGNICKKSFAESLVGWFGFEYLCSPNLRERNFDQIQFDIDDLESQVLI